MIELFIIYQWIAICCIFFQQHPTLSIYGALFTIGHGAHHDFRLGESSTASPVCRLKQAKRGALLEVFEPKVVRVNGKSLDKAAKITLNGGDEIIFRSPVRHAYVSFSIVYFFIY
ncbi:hypothetical protein ZEAMMB73_Zm00001d045717 [Zea mays]|uniref:FHA domain-containing protein n=1 Tax=Zea mays TaxID=4577 RepID=A0A1D6NYG5_MAIZE|nr:hypothetical protein ZEAMMB73_Zm00001d045717 [Zea mays]